MRRMINEHLCSGKLGRCCKHLPHGGRWAEHQQGKDRGLEKSNILTRWMTTQWESHQQCEDEDKLNACIMFIRYE